MNSFFIVGSWDNWRSLTVLTPIRPDHHICQVQIEVRRSAGVEEFQILQNRDWAKRFYPSADGCAILGPSDMHGANWRVAVPAQCKRLKIVWNPRGARSISWKFFGHSGREIPLDSGNCKMTNTAALDNSYYLVGSWDSWKQFIEFKPQDAEVPENRVFCAQVKVTLQDQVEFHIIQYRDWALRFHPASNKEDGIEGPTDKLGSNWVADIPARCHSMEVLWKPGHVGSQDRKLWWRFPGAAARHIEAATDFTALLLQLRSESPGGSGWLDGMSQIFSALEVCQRESQYGKRAEPDATARCLLATLTRDAETMRDEQGPAQPCQQVAFVQLEAQAEEELVVVSGPLQHSSADWMEQAVPIDEAEGTNPDCPVLSLFQRLVYLPLVMYVRNTVHLYEMLERLKAQAYHKGRLRSLLDGTGTVKASPYSWLIFGVIGALQTLYRVRSRMGSDRFPLELLASSPPHTIWSKIGDACAMPEVLQKGAKVELPLPAPRSQRRMQCDNCHPMRAVGTFRQGVGLMYRGIWLAEGIDDDTIRFSYSFQSFSRCIEGVMRVLRFYSGIANTKPSEAAASGRLLIYVGRHWPDCPWVTPVQLFDGPKKQAKDSEEELLLPPFAIYDFESDLSVDPEFEVHEKQERVAELEARWELELPEKLKHFVFGLIPNMQHTQAHARGGPAASLRFISNMALAAPVARLFEDTDCHLYAWANNS